MKSWQRELIESERVATLATAGPDGQPHAVPIVFAYEDGVLFTPLDRKPKRAGPGELQRVRNLERNPRATVLIHHYEADWARLAWLQLRGQAEVIQEGTRWARALELLEAKYPQYAELPLAGQPVIAVTVEQIVSWRAAQVEG